MDFVGQDKAAVVIEVGLACAAVGALAVGWVSQNLGHFALAYCFAYAGVVVAAVPAWRMYCRNPID